MEMVLLLNNLIMIQLNLAVCKGEYKTNMFHVEHLICIKPKSLLSSRKSRTMFPVEHPQTAFYPGTLIASMRIVFHVEH